MVAVATAAIVLGAMPAAASTPPKVIAHASASGQYAATSVVGTKRNAHALYLRAYGRGLDGGGAVTCVRGVSVSTRTYRSRRLVSGRLYRLPTPLVGGTCSIAVTVSGRGSIRVQVLA